jgi:UDP-glucose 4-epimerase
VSQALVTGGAGFIGSSMVRGLLARGWQVRVLDDFSTGRRSNFQEVAEKIEVLEGSVCDAETCRQAARGCHAVFHLAADVSVPRSMIDPGFTHRINVDGLYNCLVAAREAAVKRFVFASSSAVYGENPEQPKRETMAIEPISPYGASKAIGEVYGGVFSRCFGVPTVCLRYFNVFGPRQDPKSVYAAAIPAFVSRMLKGLRPVVYGDGEQSRDFTFVENIVSANLLAAEAQVDTPVVLNIACGASITVNRIIRELNQLLGTKLEPQYEAPRAGDIKHSWADVSAAEKVLGYKASIGFEEGLR